MRTKLPDAATTTRVSRMRVDGFSAEEISEATGVPLPDVYRITGVRAGDRKWEAEDSVDL